MNLEQLKQAMLLNLHNKDKLQIQIETLKAIRSEHEETIKIIECDTFNGCFRKEIADALIYSEKRNIEKLSAIIREFEVK